MADIINLQELADAKLDAQSLERFINGDVDEEVLTRLSQQYPSLQNFLFQFQKYNSRAYKTFADMDADKATISAKSKVTVTNDATASNNGDWQWDGTVFTKSTYDPLTQSKSYTDALRTDLAPWFDQTKIAEFANNSAAFKTASKAILAASASGLLAGTEYRIGTIFKNHNISGSIIYLVNPSNAVVASYTAANTVVKSGIETVTLTGGLGITAYVTINWDMLANGFSASLPAESKLYLAKTARNVYSELSAVDINEVYATMKPAWFYSPAESELKSASSVLKKLAYAIKGVQITGASASAFYRFVIITKNDPVQNNRISLFNDAGVEVLRFQDAATKVGTSTVSLSPVNASGLSGTVTLDWDLLANGTVLNSATSPLKVSPNSKDLASARSIADQNKADIAVLQATIGSSTGAATLATKPYRVSVAGSSITWGQGYLGELSYVGILEQNLRNKMATTLHAKDIASSASTLTGNNWYLGQAKRISGVNTQVEFQMTGDELSLSIGRERSNAGAANIQLYVDNVLHDTFNTLNNEPKGSATKNFNGNGADLKFNLGECFTYDHVVTVGGVSKTGSLNIQGAGGSIPVNDDFMVVRQYDSTLNKVTHVVWFKTAPTGAIVVNYSYGENISHMKGSLGHNGAGFSSTLESSYGDGSVAFDTTLPSSVSSGLGFRQSDERSVVTYKFDDIKSRTFKLVVSGLATGSTGATPYLDLNFVTNRMHHIQNAGIGGWTATALLNHTVKINTINEVINFNPDIVLIESSTNDDWSALAHKATVARTGLNNAQILAEPTSNYFSSISGASDNKSVSDVRLPIIAVTDVTVQLGSTITNSGIAAGDIITLGVYGGNQKRVAVRIVKAYDSVTRTVTLNRSISIKDFQQLDALSDLTSQHAIITNAPTWVADVKACCDAVLLSLPACKLAIGTSGIPNYYHRRLFGYNELGQKIAKDYNINVVDFYNASRLYQHSQTKVIHQTITSTGAATYAVTGSQFVLGDFVVKVDGVEHKKCRITGGLSQHWAGGVTDPTLDNDSALFKAYQLIFDANIPVNGVSIVIEKSAKLWADDYCHPNNPQGLFVFGQAASKVLKSVV